MPLPFLIAGAVVAGAYGVKKGVDAKSDIDAANRINKTIKEEAECANDKLETQKNKTNESLEAYGLSKKMGIESINLFDSFIAYPNGERRNNQLRGGKKFAENYPKIIITPEEEIAILKELHILDDSLSFTESQKQLEIKTVEFDTISGTLESVASGSLAGLAAGGGAWLGVGSLGAASTGTAIGGLSGAAATNATLAWLGGGSLASGGLGIAGGTAVLGGIVAGPLLAIGGAVMASKAAETKNKAKEALAELRGNIKKVEVVISKLEAIQLYTDECRDTFDKLADKFRNKLLVRVEQLAEQNLKFNELSMGDRALIYASYELNYLLRDFINEPTMNADGDNALEPEKRLSLKKVDNMQYNF